MQTTPVAKKFFIASLIYFLLGLLAQAVAVFDVWLGFNPLAYTAVSATEQLLLLGWLTQLGLGFVYGYWVPTAPSSLKTPSPVQHSAVKAAPSSHGTVVFVLFNIGLPLVVVGQPGLILFGGDWLGAGAAFGGLLQLFAGLLFGRDAWKAIVNYQ